MGTDPKTSVLNRYQQSWDMHNLFVLGASSFPNNAGYNPTGTIGALSLCTVKAIGDRYLCYLRATSEGVIYLGLLADDASSITITVLQGRRGAVT